MRAATDVDVTSDMQYTILYARINCVLHMRRDVSRGTHHVPK